MGNRGTVIFTDGKQSFSPAVYLHWNGSAESVYGFLEELNRRKVRADQDYECARFIQLVGEFFDQDKQGGYSLGVVNSPESDQSADLAKVHTDKGDNGIYLVNRTTNPMVIRRFHEHIEFGQGNDYTITMVELTPKQVETERNQAYADKYGLLKEEFTAIAHGREVAMV